MGLLSENFSNNINNINKLLRVDESFDLIYRTFKIAQKRAAFYFIDGFVKDELLEKIMEAFFNINDKDMVR